MAALIDEVEKDETIAELVAGSGEGRRSFRRIVYGLCGLAILAMAVVMMRPLLWPRSLTEQASKILPALPAGAKVVKVSPARWEGDGTVVFSLPEPKGPGSRLQEVWSDAGHPLPPVPVRTSALGIPVSTPAVIGPVRVTSTKNRLSLTNSVSFGVDSATLTYDPAAKLYTYERTTPH